jgi:hypothetical protein
LLAFDDLLKKKNARAKAFQIRHGAAVEQVLLYGGIHAEVTLLGQVGGGRFVAGVLVVRESRDIRNVVVPEHILAVEFIGMHEQPDSVSVSVRATGSAYY